MTQLVKRPLTAIHPSIQDPISDQLQEYLQNDDDENSAQPELYFTEHTASKPRINLSKNNNTHNIRYLKRKPKKQPATKSNTIHQDKQQLYFEALSLKQKFHDVQSENIKLKSKIISLEKELNKKNKIILKRSNSDYLMNKETQISSTLTSNLKSLLKQERSKYEKLQQQYEDVKKSVKYTKIVQLQLQLKQFEEEAIRLNSILKQVNHASFKQKQSTKKLMILQRKYKDKQQQNMALLELNLEYQKQLKSIYKQKRQKEDDTKNRQIKLVSDLDCVRKRLAASLKRRQILQCNLKKIKSSHQLNEKNDNKQLFKGKQNMHKQGFEKGYRSHQTLKRPITASYKSANISRGRNQELQSVNKIKKHPSEYQNSRYYEEQFDDAEQFNQNNTSTSKRCRTIKQQPEECYFFDELCFLITYRLMAQNYSYKSFADEVKKRFEKNINMTEVQQILQSSPFFLEQDQSKFLIKYIFNLQSDMQTANYEIKVDQLMDFMRQIIHQFQQISDNEIKMTRLKLRDKLKQKGEMQRIQAIFNQKNGYLQHDDLHDIFEELQFTYKQIQIILAQLSLFVYDLSQFTFSGLQKYLSVLQQKQSIDNEHKNNILQPVT